MALRDELKQIYSEYGKLTPKLVVEVARPVGHPLHDLVFNKSVEDAAEAWYLSRAQELIQSIKLEAIIDGEPKTVREWLSIDAGHGPSYEPVAKVARSPRMKEIALRNMEREWRQLFQRYQDMEGFFEMVQADIGKRRRGGGRRAA
jgi:hypothetical protein